MQVRQLSCLALIASSAMVVASESLAATLDGASFRVDYLAPDVATVFADTDGPIFGVVGAGTDAQIVLEGDTTIFLDFTAASLEVFLSTTLTDPIFDSDAFNGLRITFVDLPYVISGFELFGNSLIVTPSFSTTELFINWAGSGYDDGDTASFDVDLAPVPLPAGLPLLVAGLGAMAALRSRRSRLNNG